MRKSLELTHPNSCFNKARDDEMLFVLLGRDRAAPEAVRAWADRRIALGLNKWGDPQILEALAWAEEVEAGQRG